MQSMVCLCRRSVAVAQHCGAGLAPMHAWSPCMGVRDANLIRFSGSIPGWYEIGSAAENFQCFEQRHASASFCCVNSGKNTSRYEMHFPSA